MKMKFQIFSLCFLILIMIVYLKTFDSATDINFGFSSDGESFVVLYEKNYCRALRLMQLSMILLILFFAYLLKFTVVDDVDADADAYRKIDV